MGLTGTLGRGFAFLLSAVHSPFPRIVWGFCLKHGGFAAAGDNE